MPLPSDPRGRELFLMTSRDMYERWLIREIEFVLRGGFEEVVTSLVTNYVNLTPAQRTRQMQLFQRVNRALESAFADAEKFATSQFNDYTAIESTVARRSLESSTSGVELTFDALSKEEIRQIAALPIAGLNIGEWFEKQASDMSVYTRRQIQLGLLAGETPSQIVKRILPTTNELTPVAFKQARRNAFTLVRTTMTTVQNNAALETYIGAGQRVTESYRFVAVRDARTSALCRAASNQIFRFDDRRKKMPPLHPNCRSTIVPIINYERLGIERPPENSPFTFQSYDSWLREQSAEMQSMILGPSRQRLYAENRMGLQEMVATDNRVLTLTELRRRLTG